jgi:ribulose-5-phosphate 4-epimerase/fuculose-1-phosphate aldolase
MGDRNVCVLKSHGNIVVAESIEQACVWAIWTEKAARYQYEAMLLGDPDWYPEEQIEKITRQQMVGKSHLRTWNYYKWKVG